MFNPIEWFVITIFEFLVKYKIGLYLFWILFFMGLSLYIQYKFKFGTYEYLNKRK